MYARAVVLRALSGLGGSGTRNGTRKERQEHELQQAGGGSIAFVMQETRSVDDTS
jgi:hypothetical protein